MDYDGTLEGVGRWLDSEVQHIASDKIFCKSENTNLLYLNEVIRNAYRAFDYLEIEDPPKRLARAEETAAAVHRVRDLAAFVRSKIKKGWQSSKQEQTCVVSGSITVARWSELGIGIDEKGYFAFSPCPATGAKVMLREGVRLELIGDRWRKMLACFARSADGRTVAKAELVLEFGYVKAGYVSREQAEYDDKLKAQAKDARTKLTATMADLGRELRPHVVIAPERKTKKTTPAFQSVGEEYRAAFTIRHLIRDEDRYVRFGRVE